MNNSIKHHRLFRGDKAVLANFVRSELSALIHCLRQSALVQAPQTTMREE